MNERMNERLDYAAIFPAGVEAMRLLERPAAALGRRLLELVKIRASQLNGCAYCIDMHTQVARALGESEQRIYALSAWRETPFFDERERAALAWTEALTQIQSGVPEELYRRIHLHFDESQLVALTFAIVAINGWNRIAIASGKVPGTFRAAAPVEPAAGAVSG